MTLFADVRDILRDETLVTTGGDLPNEGPFVILESDGGEMVSDVQRHFLAVRVFSSYETEEGASEQLQTDVRRIAGKLSADSRVIVHQWSAELATNINTANNAVWVNSDIRVSDF